MDASQSTRMSSDPETEGFDLSAGKTWIYPENYPLRDYQFSIVQTTLFNNTLVCLPTGLGKTFIAAVIMYNFWRWYPRGKVVFLAPTRPLVAQQIYACHNTMGIPSTETIQLTGAINPKQRDVYWFKKRVIFATPQVFQKDLEKNIVPTELVKCVVIDEAHKALGKHSYCECVRLLSEKNPYFRILALSATPGNKLDNVHEIVKNLHISNIELRDESSPDIVPYINERKVDIILVSLGRELAEYKERYINIMDRHVRVLTQCNVLQAQAANITKGRIFHTLSEFQKKTNRTGNYGQIIKTLNILLTMYHAFELMIRHGLRAFYKFYQNHSDKFWINDEYQLHELLEDVHQYLGPFPDVQPFSDDNIPQIPHNLNFGHNKFHKLKELLLQHFQRANDANSDTRAIVFVEYREIVNEVYILLLQSRPLIRPQMFVGQAGQKQKHQIKALENFRKNNVNVLISTSIGEEGLDVGEVDLIICFDISQQSPTRLVQRMGRTGRKRDGHIIVLVTDGKEHETLKSTMARRDSLNRKILNTSNIFASLYEDNPRMIPNNLNPACHKMHINVQPKTPLVSGRRKKAAQNEEKKKAAKSNKSNQSETKNAHQPLMSKFLRAVNDDELNERGPLVSPATSENNMQNIAKVCKPTNVKLLSCDNDAVEFLTLLAMKDSEKELCPREVKKIDTTYTCAWPMPTNFFDFAVPNVKVLDCISSLENKETEIFATQHQIYTVNDDNNEMDNDQIIDNVWFSPVQQTQLCERLEQSRFEDLLDESSDSNETVILDDSEQNGESRDPATECGSFTKSGVEEECDDMGVTTLDNSEPGIFEDILNESSNESDQDVLGTVHEPQEESKNVSASNAKDDTKAKRFSVCINDTNEFVYGNEGIFESKVDSPDNSRVADETPSANKTRKSLFGNESMLSITQAIQELAKHTRNESIRVRELVDLTSEEDMFDSDKTDEASRDTVHDDPANKHLETRSSDVRIAEEPSTRDNNNRDEKSAERSEFQVDDLDWESDFEVHAANAKQPTEPSTSRPRETSAIISFDKSNFEDSSSSEWIDARSTKVESKTPRRTGNLARKLSTLKNALASKSDARKSRRTEPSDSEDDFFVMPDDAERLDGLESSFFRDAKEFALMSNNASTPASRAFASNGNVTERHKSVKICAPSGTRVREDKVARRFAEPNRTASLDREPSRRRNRAGRKHRGRIRSEFIDDEAEVSSDGSHSSDESSDGDDDLADFVSYTQDARVSDDMRAHYLQTVRSPLKRPGAFMFREPRPVDADLEVFSQQLSQPNESYLYDSFCVQEDEDNADESARVPGYTILEEAERLLRRKKRKRDSPERARNGSTGASKRLKKVNALNTSTSSEDELEKLREQIKDESMILKNLRD